MTERFDIPAMGWLPDLPDFRDYTTEHDQVGTRLKALGQKDSVKKMLKKVGAEKASASLPGSANLRQWCSPVENQLNIGSCTAQAGVRQAYRCLAAVSLQGNAQPAALDRGYRRIPANHHGGHEVVRRAAGGLLSLRCRRFR